MGMYELRHQRILPRVGEMLHMKYPGFDFIANTSVPGDYVEIQIRQRGSYEFKTCMFSNTQLAMMSPHELEQRIEAVMHGSTEPKSESKSEPVVKHSNTPTEQWVEEWSKKQL